MSKPTRTTTRAYTPGPWRIASFDRRRASIAIDSAGGWSIAHVWGLSSNESFPPDTEAVANATLAAAAPDLLEACVESLEQWRILRDHFAARDMGGFVAHDATHLDRLGAAIAKATEPPSKEEQR